MLDAPLAARLRDAGLLGDWPRGNLFDEVHLDGDRIVHFASQRRGTVDMEERVQWWLEEGQEE